MARWRLTATHYLNVPGTEWEYTETDRGTGRPKRYKFQVPRLLDIHDPSDHNHRVPGYPELGEIYVCHVGKGIGNDIEFIGPPTPDMEPLDDEAKEISGRWAEIWKSRPDFDSGQTYGDTVFEGLAKQLGDAATAATSANETGMTELKAMMVENQKQFNETMAMMASILKTVVEAARAPSEQRRI